MFDVVCTSLRLVGLIVIFLEILLTGLAGNKTADVKSGKNYWFPLALAAFVMAGISQCLANLPSYLIEDQSGSIGKTAAIQLGTLIAFGLVAAGKKQANRGMVNWKPVMLLSATTLIGQYFFFYHGLDLVTRHGAGSIGYPIALGTCIAAFSLFSLLVLREHINFAAIGSFVLGLIGIVLLSLRI